MFLDDYVKEHEKKVQLMTTNSVYSGDESTTENATQYIKDIVTEEMEEKHILAY